MTELYWLPEVPDWSQRLEIGADSALATWEKAVSLANSRLDFIRTNALDTKIQKLVGPEVIKELTTKPIRLAVLGSCTTTHLHSAIRVAGCRRGIWIDTYEVTYGQYLQELLDGNSGLHKFKPNAVIFAFDAHHLVQGLEIATDREQSDSIFEEVCSKITHCWSLAHDAFGCPIIQQSVLNTLPPILGNNEHRLAGSKHAFISKLNPALRKAADENGVEVLALDVVAARDGLNAWHDKALWHRSKQDINPAAAPMYGDLVARLLAAKQGLSYKCLVLDLDNTLWGGVIGDDGLEGIELGQGSPLGEGFTALQAYARELSQRGVILAVCSKNDEANAVEPFEKHPEMVLRREDISCFRANWNDKAENIRAIAYEIGIGLDAMVFLDDNPFERALIRRELPMVAVPEVPDEPALFIDCLADAGYFESLALTGEDWQRKEKYRDNRAREKFKGTVTDMKSYLAGLEMKLIWRRFDRVGLARIVQLINKTNQFNLTTRRYSEEDVLGMIAANDVVGLQCRLVDRFGDNGIIAIIIGRLQGSDLSIDTWLMSCRVLGRQVEQTTLKLIADQARSVGATRLIGEFVPTKKNGMVSNHYQSLGFCVLETQATGRSKYSLDLNAYAVPSTFVELIEDVADDDRSTNLRRSVQHI